MSVLVQRTRSEYMLDVAVQDGIEASHYDSDNSDSSCSHHNLISHQLTIY
jgi:hypothetical protein